MKIDKNLSHIFDFEAIELASIYCCQHKDRTYLGIISKYPNKNASRSSRLLVLPFGGSFFFKSPTCPNRQFVLGAFLFCSSADRRPSRGARIRSNRGSSIKGSRTTPCHAKRFPFRSRPKSEGKKSAIGELFFSIKLIMVCGIPATFADTGGSTAINCCTGSKFLPKAKYFSSLHFRLDIPIRSEPKGA